MKKIIVTYPLFRSYGGAENSSLEMLRLLKKKYRVTLIFCGKIFPKIQLPKGVKTLNIKSKFKIINYLIGKYIIFSQFFIIIYLSKKNLKNFEFVFSLHGELSTKIKTFQFIHFPFFTLNILNFLSLGIKPYELHKFLLRLFSVSFMRLYFYLNKLKFDTVATICNSKWTKTIFQKEYKVSNDIYLNFIYFTYMLKNPIVENYQAFKKRNNSFVILGRVSKDKNIYEAIKVFKKINAKFNYKYTLQIIGPVDDNKYYKKCLGISDNKIIFTGFLNEENKRKILLNSKYALHLFKNEHFGIAPAEMQNYGIIVFVYKGGGILEIIDNKYQTFLNYRELKNKIVFLLKNNSLENSVLKEMHKNQKILQNNFESNFFNLFI